MTNENPQSEEASNSNKHVFEFLDYFISFPRAPRYAVLLNGAWGVGKTYLVRRFLSQKFREKNNYVWVSLYGLKDSDDIDAALFQALYPLLGWKGVKIGGRIGKAALKFFKIDADIELKELISKFSAQLYVFDDLERCDMPINEVLGYINEFVEHDGCKVLIIANESEIPNNAEYRKRREKLIGKTLEVQSAFDEALSHFISEIDDPEAKGFFASKTPEITSLYHQSQLNNLRIVQQTMWDFERVFRVLTNEHRKRDFGLTVLLRLFLALSFELKAGRIAAEDLKGRVTKIVAGMASKRDGEPLTSLARASGRYPEIHLHDPILPDGLLTDILAKGVIEEGAIRSALDQSGYFVESKDEPAWRVLWHAYERTDDDAAAALNEVERQFAARELTISGELLHVFGLRLWAAKIGALTKSPAEIVTECKKYVDDLYSKKQLEPLPLDQFSEIQFNGHGGLGMHEHESSEFLELFNYLHSRRQAADEDRYPPQGGDLLKEMEEDADLFFRRVCATNSPDNIYARVPVLKAIEPDKFTSTLLRLHPASQRTVFLALKSRYEHGQLERELLGEAAWIGDVYNLLVKAAKAMAPIPRHRLESILEYSIKPKVAVKESNDGKA